MAGGLLGALSSDADAQAWVAEKGELSTSVNYTYGTSSDLVDPRGSTYDNEDLSINNHTMTLGAMYTPIDKLGLSVSLPILFVKYAGVLDGGFPAHGPWDDNKLHTTPTDLRLSARYQVLSGVRAFSPHIALSVPTHDYVTHGYAGAGRNILQGIVGFSAGAVLEPFLPNAFVHVSTEFSVGTKPVVEDPRFAKDALDEYGQSAVGGDLTLGYFVTDKLTVSGLVLFHNQLDGAIFDQVNPNMRDDVLFDWHDIVLKESYVHAGLDVGYDITPALSASAYVRAYVTGKNTRNSYGGGIGFSYTILKSDDPVISDDWYDEEDVYMGEDEMEGDDDMGDDDMGDDTTGDDDMGDDATGGDADTGAPVDSGEPTPSE